jgi:ABC-type nitrate/sulfonate/bicarbonate transport system ATPase subunit
VVVMAPRPGRIVAQISVGLTRPNPAGIEDTNEFAEYVKVVRAALRDAVISAQVMP